MSYPTVNNFTNRYDEIDMLNIGILSTNVYRKEVDPDNHRTES